MRVAVVGIGGVGGYYGGKLAYAYPQGSGHEVIFFCRGAHLDAIKRSGLKLDSADGEITAVPSLATNSASDIGVVDVVLLCVKGYDLLQTARSVASIIGPETVVIPLGNGVNNDEIVRSALECGDVLNGCVYISTHIEAPGFVQQTGGSRKLFFGPSEGDVEPYRVVERFLVGAEIDAELTSDVQEKVWSKFVFIGPVSGVTSLHGVSIGQMLAQPDLKSTLSQMMHEVETVASRKGVCLPPDMVEKALATGASFPFDTKSSMQLDVENGRKAELETMLGYVVAAGRDLGVETPAHVNIYEALRSRTA
ncbi:MAG: 2-dehydropantoate 2-reductase [Dehalococcoidia bacterium]|nr:2-dehydropantoate 2-reductase [Dehalococcoidia bacterium]